MYVLMATVGIIGEVENVPLYASQDKDKCIEEKRKLEKTQDELIEFAKSLNCSTPHEIDSMLRTMYMIVEEGESEAWIDYFCKYETLSFKIKMKQALLLWEDVHTILKKLPFDFYYDRYGDEAIYYVVEVGSDSARQPKEITE